MVTIHRPLQLSEWGPFFRCRFDLPNTLVTGTSYGIGFVVPFTHSRVGVQLICLVRDDA